MIQYSVQIRNNKEWGLNSKNYFYFKNDLDLSLFCYRLAAINQKEIRVQREGHTSGRFFYPENSDEKLDYLLTEF